MNPFFQKLRSLMHRRRKEEDLRDELQFHLDEEAEERQAEGLPGDEARHAARRDIGNIALVQEETRAVWTWTYLEQLAQDCRYAVRTMAANKTFSLLAILSLALGIGANTAIYSFMDSLLLRSLPVSDPESLAVLNWGAQPNRTRFRDAGYERQHLGAIANGQRPPGSFLFPPSSSSGPTPARSSRACSLTTPHAR